MTKSVILPHRAIYFFLKHSVSQLPNIPLTPTTLQQFIAAFTCPQYTRSISVNILHEPI